MNTSTSGILIYAIIGAAVTIYVPFTMVGYARAQLGYNRNSPRAMFDKLPPYAQRATWAHQNSLETFMVFAAAALMAYVTQVDSVLASTVALVFVAARLFFALFYIINIPILRSLMFGVGSLCIMILFYLSVMQVNG